MRNSNKLDERQRAIRSKVMAHTLLFMMGLLLINGFIQAGNRFLWASVLNQNFLIIMLTSTFMICEAIFRGAYFGINFDKKRVRRFLIVSIFWGLLVIIDFLRFLLGDRTFIHFARLTDSGANFLIYLFLFISDLAVILGWYRERKDKSKQDLKVIDN